MKAPRGSKNEETNETLHGSKYIIDQKRCFQREKRISPQRHRFTEGGFKAKKTYQRLETPSPTRKKDKPTTKSL